jgi:hypothetical protein
MATKPRILAVGSCRIARPLRSLHKLGVIDFANKEEPWFTHSSGEGLQYVRLIRGSLKLDERLRPFVDVPDREESPSLARPGSVRDIDLVLVEISALKVATVAGEFVHVPKVWTAADALGLDNRASTSKRGVPWPAGHPLRDIKLAQESEADIVGNLRAIGAEVQAPVTICDHIHALDTDGNPLPARERLSELLSEIGHKHGIPKFSTKDMLVQHDQQAALLDSTHYRDSFEKTAGEYFWSFLSQALASYHEKARLSA